MMCPIFDFSNRPLKSTRKTLKRSYPCLQEIPHITPRRMKMSYPGKGNRLNELCLVRSNALACQKCRSNNFTSPTCDLTLNNGLFRHSLVQVTIKMLCPSTSTFNSAAALNSASHFPTTFLKFQRTGLLLSSSKHYSHSSAH